MFCWGRLRLAFSGLSNLDLGEDASGSSGLPWTLDTGAGDDFPYFRVALDDWVPMSSLGLADDEEGEIEAFRVLVLLDLGT